jgi:WD40 repeat protein
VTGSLTDARELHTATLLTQGAQNGEVLVTGGFGVKGFLDSTELYDPSTGTWSPSGSLVNAVDAQTATLLNNGKVLIAGGFSGVAPVANAELWNPNSGKWSNTGFMTTGRGGQTATLLPNGQVLAAGGGGPSGEILTSAELYTPGNGRWAATGSMNTGRLAGSAALLPNGNVLVTGGQDSSGNPLASSELFSLDTDLNLVMPADKTVNATSPAGAIVNYKPNVNDENTATTSLNCSPPSGSTFPVGDTTVTCTATDTDGDLNSPAQGTMIVHVLGAAAQVAALETEVIGVGTGTSLADKLAAVASDLASNDTTDACGTLDAFINEVRAQAGASIPGALAGKLISAALRIERVIGC